MKALLSLLLLTTRFVYGQTPATVVRHDSVPDSPGAMPTVRPPHSFYRNEHDSQNVVRSTLDNMPVKIPDSSTYYTLQRYHPHYPPGKPLPYPFPRNLPKKP